MESGRSAFDGWWIFGVRAGDGDWPAGRAGEALSGDSASINARVDFDDIAGRGGRDGVAPLAVVADVDDG
jgi:hypothetical protein